MQNRIPHRISGVKLTMLTLTKKKMKKRMVETASIPCWTAYPWMKTLHLPQTRKTPSAILPWNLQGITELTPCTMTTQMVSELLPALQKHHLLIFIHAVQTIFITTPKGSGKWSFVIHSSQDQIPPKSSNAVSLNIGYFQFNNESVLSRERINKTTNKSSTVLFKRTALDSAF